ncbi:unnamed protein product [Mortierella alpina]
MKPESAAHAVFTTPELAATLFSTLSPDDLTRCARVCKQWMNHAGPVLWRNFSYGGPRLTRLPPNTTAGVIRNLPHIRTVELTLHDHAALQDLAHGVPQSSQPGDDPTTRTHLKRLTLEKRHNFDEDIDPILRKIVTLLNRNLHLTHLTFPLPEVELGDPVLAAISNLKHLQSLTVYSCNSSSRVGTETISLLLRTCLPLPKLTELRIDLNVSWKHRHRGMSGLGGYGFGFSDDEDVDISDDDDEDAEVVDDEEAEVLDDEEAEVLDDEEAEVLDGEKAGDLSFETIIKEAAIARFSQTPTAGKIKSLQLPCAPERSNNPLALPLLQSGLLDLESCTIFSFAKNSQPKEIEELVREYCPNLRHLRYTNNGDLKEAQLACAFIRGCSRLQSFAAVDYCEEIYTYDRNPSKSRHIISTLVSHHCDTLEDFELEHCTGMFMSDLREVLSRCGLLKRYHVTGYYLEARGTYRNGIARSDLMDPSGDEWACTELKELRMTLDRTVEHLAKRFYAQIGRLEKLENLTLDGTRDPYSIERHWDCSYDLTLSRGYLGQMVGLKNLRSLRVDRAFYRNMGHDELVFIQLHCPRLRYIKVLG